MELLQSPRVTSPYSRYSIPNLVYVNRGYIQAQCKEILFFIMVILIAVKYLQRQFRKKRKKCQGSSNGKFETVVEKYEAYKSLPGPIVFPFIGIPIELLFNSDIIFLSVEWARRYGHCYRMKIFNEEFVILNSPAYAQAILTSTDDGHAQKAWFEEFLWPEGIRTLVNFTGDEWRTRRKMLNRSFTYKSLRNYNECFNRQSGKLINELEELFKDGKVHHIDKVVRTCIFRQSSETLMGVDMSEMGDGEIFVESVNTIMSTTFARAYSPWLMIPGVFRHLLGRQYNEAIHKTGQVTQKVILKYQEKLANEEEVRKEKGMRELSSIDDENTEEDCKTECVIEVMLRNGVPEEQIFHEVAVMLAIAHDTTSLSVGYTLFLLALYPEHQRKCQEEIDRIFDDPTKYKDGVLDYNVLTELKYLERCLLESQRVYPMASLMRTMKTPLRLSEDLVIPAGVSVAYISHSIHLNPEWYPNPQEFNPDRFLPEEVKKRHPYAFVPFSGGPRICIGMKLALVELKIALSKILRNFDVYTPDAREDLKLTYIGLPKPVKPINFLFKKRNINNNC